MRVNVYSRNTFCYHESNMDLFNHEIHGQGTHRERLLSQLALSLNEFGVAQDMQAKEICLKNYQDSLKFLRKRLTASGLHIREWNLFGSTASVLRLPILKSLLLNRSNGPRMGVYPMEYTMEDAERNVLRGHEKRTFPSDIDLILDADSDNLTNSKVMSIKYFARKHTFNEYGVFVQFT